MDEHERESARFAANLEKQFERELDRLLQKNLGIEPKTYEHNRAIETEFDRTPEHVQEVDNVKEFERKLDLQLEKYLGIEPQSYETPKDDGSVSESARKAELEKEYQRKLDLQRQKYIAIETRSGGTYKEPEIEKTPEREADADSDKPIDPKDMPSYDSRERRDAVRRHLERQGVSKELQELRHILELGHGAPMGQDPGDRRDPESRGAGMRTKDSRSRENKGLERDR